ncbi:hypothetical protein RchiOBHm_Chr2g0150591 [Rosa chinensis]|uniref:Uncharacterized protein n=1 Tax=Rosa chinensis TaxID=74649 RepID=A0A2P6S000_ROSCH|nr:hypothetical protein RchiOBHm_Chr2g0150591 [Rosa chinensis]
MQKSVGFIVLLLFLCLLLCTVYVSYSAIIGENSKKEAYSLTSATTTVHSIKLAIMAPKPRMTKKRRLLEGDHSSADLCHAASYNESLSSEGNMQEIKNDQTFVASIAESSFDGDSIHDQIMARTAVMPKQGTSRRSLQLRVDKSVSNSDCVQYVSEQSHKNKRRKPTSAINFNCGASTSSNLEVEIAASHGNSVGQASYQRRKCAVMPKQRTGRRSLQLRADKSVDNSDCVKYVSEQSHKNKRRKPTPAINFNYGASTSNNLEVEIAASHGNSIGQASYQRRKCGFKPEDRPDIVSRIFKMKNEDLSLMSNPANHLEKSKQMSVRLNFRKEDFLTLICYFG